MRASAIIAEFALEISIVSVKMMPSMVITMVHFVKVAATIIMDLVARFGAMPKTCAIPTAYAHHRAPVSVTVRLLLAFIAVAHASHAKVAGTEKIAELP